MTLPDSSPTRKQRFEAALKLAGLTLRDWSNDFGVDGTHVGRVLSGERPGGAELNDAIDMTIARYLGGVAPMTAALSQEAGR
jgi:hypothetical protein